MRPPIAATWLSGWMVDALPRGTDLGNEKARPGKGQGFLPTGMETQME
jgi:hypothetical protein